MALHNKRSTTELFRALCAFALGVGIGYAFICGFSDCSRLISAQSSTLTQVRVADCSAEVKRSMRPKPKNFWYIWNQTSTAKATTTITRLTTTTGNPKSAINETRLQYARKAYGNAKCNVTGNETLYISSPQVARLGNLMFEFASTYGIARKTGKRVHLGESNPVLSAFPKLREVALVTRSRNDSASWHTLVDNQNCAYLRWLEDAAFMPCNVSLSGYMQSFKYFVEFSDEVRKLLRFNGSIQQSTDALMKASREKAQAAFAAQKATIAKAENITELFWIAVHVRRGDITFKQNFIKFGYLTATSEYLSKASSHFLYKYGKPHVGIVFLVFSDDIPWCKANFTVGDRKMDRNHRYNVQFVGSDDRALDLSFMSRCNATIMTVGSFGWWAAFLAGGETFYYAYPYISGSELNKMFIIDDYYLPHWHPAS